MNFGTGIFGKDDVCVVYFGGPIGSGKSTSASMMRDVLSGILKTPKIETLSFAGAVRKEVEERFGIPISATLTQEGKASKLKDVVSDWDSRKENIITVLENEPTTVREALQAWGSYRRATLPDYWAIRVRENIVQKVEQENTNIILVDDVRFGNEATILKNIDLFIGDGYRRIFTLGVHYLGVAELSDNSLRTALTAQCMSARRPHISEWAIENPLFSRLFDLTCMPERGNLNSYVWLAADILLQKIRAWRK